MNRMEYKNYDKIRLTNNESSKKIWLEVTRFLQRYIKQDSAVLDLGSGYCNFINFIKADKKYALDKYINPSKFASAEVYCLFGDFNLATKKITDKSLDVVFASNFFEHLTDSEVEKCISLVKKKLKEGGILIAMQPNYRLCYKSYFDDFTHIKIWSDISLRDFLESRGFKSKVVKRRFMPFSMKSYLPKNQLLVRFYLRSPIKPFAGQMLIVAKNTR